MWIKPLRIAYLFRSAKESFLTTKEILSDLLKNSFCVRSGLTCEFQAALILTKNYIVVLRNTFQNNFEKKLKKKHLP